MMRGNYAHSADFSTDGFVRQVQTDHKFDAPRFRLRIIIRWPVSLQLELHNDAALAIIRTWMTTGQKLGRRRGQQELSATRKSTTAESKSER